jgi:hypothetical protein
MLMLMMGIREMGVPVSKMHMGMAMKMGFPWPVRGVVFVNMSVSRGKADLQQTSRINAHDPSRHCRGPKLA